MVSDACSSAWVLVQQSKVEQAKERGREEKKQGEKMGMITKKEL